jgi:hypothetical protein
MVKEEQLNNSTAMVTLLRAKYRKEIEDHLREVHLEHHPVNRGTANLEGFNQLALISPK